MTVSRFTSGRVPERCDEIAPDGSEIRLVAKLTGGSVAHGTLPPGSTSAAVCHRTIEEVWFVLSGSAEIWRRQDGREEVIRVDAGGWVTIPTGTAFQFRTVGKEPFRFLMCTIPPWPGPAEAYPVDGHWTASVA
jgi:mannose-6-phosphate isomerase-like protein (cupin superfamily)